MSGCCKIASTTALDPFTTFTTPGGQTRLLHQLADSRHGEWDPSEGLTMHVLPQAMAQGKNRNGIIAGKLNGEMIAVTPRGCRIMISSMPLAMFSELYPCISV